MKLHVIETTNLNSLYGDQRVDLDADLEGASLFLIQGPTGSGKSTLMDAVSLALFGTTPRLSGLGSEKAVAEQIMSRGAGVAQARLEFSRWEAGGRVRYRATWAARRAREKADGTVQATHRSLERRETDGTWALLVSDHRAKFTDPVFADVLEGFSPHDFQRSMLLAQGRFDAMLHAKPEERAAILERLTDTAQYQAIGERAARMRGAWTGRLEALRAQVQAISPTTPEALEAAHEAARSGEAAAAAVEAELESVRGQQRWLAEEAAQVASHAAAEAGRAAVAAAVSGAAAALAALAEHERCAAGFAALDEVGRAAARIHENEAQVKGVEEELPGLQAAARAAAAAEVVAEAHAARVDAALAGLRRPVPTVQRAEEKRDEAGAAAAAAAARRRDEAAAATEAGRVAAAAAAALQRAEAALGAARAAQAGRTADEALAGAFDALAARAARVSELHAAVEAETAAVRAQAAALDEEAAALAAARAAAASDAVARLAPLEAAAATARGWVGDGDPDDILAGLRGAVDAHRAALEAARAVARAQDDRARATARRDAREAALGVAADAVAAAEARDAAAAAVLVDAERERGGALAVLAPLERIAALGEQRAALVPGEPCPLCGGADHPFVTDPQQAAQAAAAAEEVARARATVEACEAAVAASARGRADAARHLAAAVAARDAAAREAEEARRDLASLAPVAVGGPPVAEAEASLVAAQAAVTEAEAAQRAAREADAALDRARREIDSQERVLDQREAARGRGVAELEGRRARLSTGSAARDAERAALGDALALHGISSDPAEAGIAEARARAEAWRAGAKAVADATSAWTLADQQRAARAEARDIAQRRAAEAEDHATACEARQAAASAEVRAAREELADALAACVALDRVGEVRAHSASGDPVAVLQEQEARAAAATRDRAVASRAAADSARAADDATARLALLRDQAAALRAAAASARAGLADAVSTLGLQDAGALAALRLPPERVATLRAERRRLEQAEAQAVATLEAVAAQLARHRAARPEALAADADPADLPAREAALLAEHGRLKAILDDARATIRHAREKQAQLAAATEQLRAAESDAAVWLRLHELIGRGDGKAFKLFAQALNLDQLLSRANRHLVRLNDRYRLRTEKDEHGMPTLEFVVEDRWRPGQTRSLKTLSGGESFLVSLALALGLSDLRTSSMPVETLLLDEGFGTLDPGTLDTALAALQQLQASGRQVGIISHVVGLHDRIEARVVVEPIGEGRSRVRAAVA